MIKTMINIILKFILLGNVFKFIWNEKIKDIFNYGVKNRNNFVIHLKIFLYTYFLIILFLMLLIN